MKQNFLLAMIIMVFTSTTVQAAEWYLLGGGELDVILVDQSTRTEDGNRAGVWITSVNIDPKLKYDTLSMYLRFDCRKKQLSLGGYLQFLKGKVIKNQDMTQFDHWEQIIPGSNGDNEWQLVCKKTRPEEMNAIRLEYLDEINYAGELAKVLQPIMREDVKNND